MDKIKKYLEGVPIYVINGITILSFVSVPISFIVQAILIWLEKIDGFQFNIIWTVIFISVICISLIRIKKYHSLLFDRMDIVSSGFSSFLKSSQDVYFEIMKAHKDKTLTLELLRKTYKSELENILDNLSNIMQSYTGRNVSACIKIINYNKSKNPNNIIDLNNATVSTLCRSKNSQGRGQYEASNSPIYIKDNTDFREIVDETINTGKPYFYVQDLREYDKLLRKSNRKYENTNKDYDDYYLGTIVVPIRIETEKVYNINKSATYDIIGFLCVDSLATDAFLPKQEVFNCNIVKAFADNIYVLLGQYAHYLKDF